MISCLQMRKIIPTWPSIGISWRMMVLKLKNFIEFKVQFPDLLRLIQKIILLLSRGILPFLTTCNLTGPLRNRPDNSAEK